MNPEPNIADAQPIEEFSMGRAWRMAGHAMQAYSSYTAMCPHTEAEANVTMDPTGDIVVAFKGSSAPEDFVQDAKTKMADLMWSIGDSAARVHEGFLEDFESITVQVNEQTRKLLAIARSPRVWITGHSLGGAQAILCALEFCRQNIPVAGVYTFGQPRVGNYVFRDLYNTAPPGGPRVSRPTLADITFRVVNENDVVPHLPGLLTGYRHCGQEVLLAYGGGWAMNPPYWIRGVSELLGLTDAWRKRRDVLVSEHFIDSYRARIKAAHFYSGDTK